MKTLVLIGVLVAAGWVVVGAPPRMETDPTPMAGAALVAPAPAPLAPMRVVKWPRVVGCAVSTGPFTETIVLSPE